MNFVMIQSAGTTQRSRDRRLRNHTRGAAGARTGSLSSSLDLERRLQRLNAIGSDRVSEACVCSVVVVVVFFSSSYLSILLT